MDALHYMTHRPWWTRCWIIQEFCLAQKAVFMCGDDEIDIDTFLQGMVLATFFSDHGIVGTVERLAAALVICISRWIFIDDENPSYREPLLELLWRFRSYKAENPRDKLYALLSLVGPEQLSSLNIKVDYSLSVAQTYVNCAMSILSSMGNLDILATDKPTKSSLQGELPSWVPDWSICTGLPHLLLDDGDGQREFCACGTSDAYDTISIFAPSDTLRLSGFAFDNIAMVEQPYTIPQFDNVSVLQSVQSVTAYLRFMKDTFYGIYHKHKVLMAWVKLGLKYDGPSPYVALGQDADTVFRTTLLLGQSAADPEAMETAYKGWRAEMRTRRELLRDLVRDLVGFLRRQQSVRGLLVAVYRATIDMLKYLVSDEDEIATREFDSMIGGTINRRIARTQTGYLAILPVQARTGDEIVLMKGSKVPLVARRIDAKWELVGPAYVYGIMYGEAWSDEACEEMLFL